MADPRWTDEAMAAIVAAITNEAKHHPGDETCEDRCVQDETVCMAASVHLAASIDGVVRSVYASPERLAEVALTALAEAGVLLPSDGVSHQEQSWSHRDGTDCTDDQCFDRRLVVRTVTEWADGSELLTPWRAVVS